MKNESKLGRFQILMMFKEMLKMEVKHEDFRFYRCSKESGKLK